MRQALHAVLTLVVLLLGGTTASAFSLLGEKGDFHVQRLGHDVGFIGGPVNINEEHRWNIPLILYGFSPEFLTYFGSRGEEEVEKAVAIINNLPTMSQIDIDTYPLNVSRVNHRAARINAVDLKSVALSLIVEELGLGDPTLYVFTLRNRNTPNNTTNFVIIKRNFDPITKHPSSYINGELYTLTTIADGDTTSQTINSPVDPLSRNFPVASFFIRPGYYYTGLTRDDVGGLRHIYNRNNHNTENADTNAFSLGFGTVVGVGGGSPWSHPVFTNATNATGDPNAGGGNTNFVITAVRPGVDKITFSRVHFDSVLGFFVQTNYAYSDTVIVNGREFVQRLGRFVPQPDFLFHGNDMTGGPTDDPPFVGVAGRSDSYQSNAALNGSYGVGGGGETGIYGPGIIAPGVVVTFNTAGYRYIGSVPNFLSETTVGEIVLWGSYDGSTNAPVIYPDGTSIEEIENRVTGGF